MENKPLDEILGRYKKEILSSFSKRIENIALSASEDSEHIDMIEILESVRNQIDDMIQNLKKARNGNTYESADS